jgi:putative phosphoribosyl transferase
LIAAIPVAPPNRLEAIRQFCDSVVCLIAPDDFWAVGQFYVDFSPVDDEYVLRLLREARIRKAQMA